LDQQAEIETLKQKIDELENPPELSILEPTEKVESDKQSTVHEK